MLKSSAQSCDLVVVLSKMSKLPVIVIIDTNNQPEEIIFFRPTTTTTTATTSVTTTMANSKKSKLKSTKSFTDQGTSCLLLVILGHFNLP